ncbi:cupin domain-containing protein [Roseiarcaceae bacterium H3SJ34-1]|uniref:cupin domain-containing protein n=1 Tax=Terripilifer ovatus TaxID=3032367 RepID=UPI003AB9254C|nr:cupin domain-containing protein [Roseiarcaceae bacterium H3SJ34-1]
MFVSLRQHSGGGNMPKDITHSRLAVHLADVPETILVPAAHLSGGAVGAQIVYGSDMSLMIATRQPGYHSKPHVHDCEQLNYVLQGELLVFIGDKGFLVRQGDAFRVPRNVVHWSWVRGDVPSILLESHAPPLIGDPGFDRTATSLIDAEENVEPSARIGSNWPRDFDREAAEAVIFSVHPYLKA